MKRKVLLSTLIVFVIAGAFSLHQMVQSYTGGAPPGFSGAPGEGSCVLCHNSYALNSGTGVVTIVFDSGFSTTYIPGKQYSIAVRIQEATITKFGFESTVLTVADSAKAGTLAVYDITRTQFKPGAKDYITHNQVGTPALITGTGAWLFWWTAPPTNIGPVKIYAGVNSSNSNLALLGDYIYTKSLLVNPASGSGLGEKTKTAFSVFPNPAEDMTNVIFFLKNESWVKISLLDLQGKLNRVLIDKTFPAGTNDIELTFDDIAKGIYFIELKAENIHEIHKLLIK